VAVVEDQTPSRPEYPLGWKDGGVPTHVALLRGINLGAHSRVAMADLRRVVTSLGHTEVATYIQSGNAVFTTQETDSVALAAGLEAAIAEGLDVHPSVVVLSRAELARVIADNPFPDERDPKHLHAVLRVEDLDTETLAGIAEAQRRATEKGSPDESRVVGRTLFLRTPDGMGRSELAAQLARSERARATVAAGTARNWATVTRLLALLDA
jgi:uncharacterized protein (DUF1697 family)